jgi:nucleoid-associated protein YgaU
MKLTKSMISLLTLLLFFSASAFAQEREMTEEEWQNEINRLTQKKSELTQELQALQKEVNDLKATNAGLQSYDDCMDELYAMVGATKGDVDNFGRKINDFEAKMSNPDISNEDLQAELDALKDNKISALPQYYDKVHNQLQNRLNNRDYTPKEIMYTVVRGDHLWGIAKKSEHYDNPFAWPMIYRANKDKINDPDLIYPKQIFKIPNLTDEEKAKYDKIRRNYKPAPLQ